MNLLEHYIVEIISEQKIQNYEGRGYYKVRAVIDCYGVESEETRIFLIDEWEKAKERGYYMG